MWLKIFRGKDRERKGSGCGSVGWAVTSDTRGPRFESSQWQILNWTFVYCEQYWKDENKEKEAGNSPFLKERERPVVRNYTYKWVHFNKLQCHSTNLSTYQQISLPTNLPITAIGIQTSHYVGRRGKILPKNSKHIYRLYGLCYHYHHRRRRLLLMILLILISIWWRTNSHLTWLLDCFNDV